MVCSYPLVSHMFLACSDCGVTCLLYAATGSVPPACLREIDEVLAGYCLHDRNPCESELNLQLLVRGFAMAWGFFTIALG